MQLDYTDEQKQLRKQLREYFTNLMTPERKAAIRNGQEESGPAYKELIRQAQLSRWLQLWLLCKWEQ